MKHKRAVILLVLLAALTLSAAADFSAFTDTATAADPKGKRENYKGILVELGQTSLTLELKDGAAVTITLTDATSFKMRGRKNVGLADLQPGMQVMVQAVRAEDGSLTARRVMVIPAKPERVHRVGVVTAYAPNESITIQAKDGQLYTFLLTSETKILPKSRADALAVGARVTNIAPRDPGATAPTARGIVVHPPQ